MFSTCSERAGRRMIGERDGIEDARQMIYERVNIDDRYIFS